MDKGKVLTISKTGIYNIFFENGGAIFNAAKHKEWGAYVASNKANAIALDEYMASMEKAKEVVVDGGKK